MTEFESLELIDQVKWLENEFQKFETFTLIHYVGITELLSHSSFKKSNDVGFLHMLIPEFTTLLCLKKKYNSINVYSNLGDYHKAIHDLHKKLFIVVKKAEGDYRNTIIRDDNSEIDKLAIMFNIQEFSLRNPVPPILHDEVLNKIYKPFDSTLSQQFGFNIEQALILSHAISDLQEQILKDEIDNASDLITSYNEELREFKLKKTLPSSQFIKSNISQLINSSDIESKKIIKENTIFNEIVLNSDVHTFQKEELAEFTEIELSVVESYLNTFSIEFGKIPETFFTPEPNHQLKKTPLIVHDKRYSCPSVPLLSFAIESLFDQFLNSINKFSEKRHNIIIETATKVILNALPGGEAYSHLRYNESKNELDALIIYDCYALIIECKGNRITERAKQGKVDRLKKHLNELIKKSHEQSTTAINYLKAAPSVDFLPKTGKKIVINSSKIKKFFPISLTVEPLEMLAILIKKVNELGISKETFPWILNIYDLLIICEHLPFPAALFNYIERRIEFSNNPSVMTHNEIDFFSWYMDYGLNLKELDIEGKTILFGDNSQHLDKYYIYKAGMGKPIGKKPMKIPKNFQNLISNIEKSKIFGRTEIINLLLNLSDGLKEKLMKLIEKTKKKFQYDNRIHDFTILSSDNQFGFTFIVDKDLTEIDRILEILCNDKIKKYDEVKYWIGIGDTGKKNLDIKILKLKENISQ